MSTDIPTKNAPTETVKVQKVKVTVPAPYKEGHKLRANEADALNTYYANCIRNAVAPAVREALEQQGALDKDGNVHSDKLNVQEIQKIIDAEVAEYDFGKSGGRTGDPVKQEAMEIARNSIRNAIRKKGKNVSDYTAKQISQEAKKLLEHEKHGPTIMEKARQIVSQREEIGDLDI